MGQRRAIVSVADKTGIEGFARALVSEGFEILSTGGTARKLSEAGIPVTPVEKVTGFPEMMDGRVKTLHPMVHGGLLAMRGNPDHVAAMAAHGIAPIDLAVVNLYPFEATVARGADYDDCVENIDIGGPAMIRAAAKNHADVAVVVDTADYEAVTAGKPKKEKAPEVATVEAVEPAEVAEVQEVAEVEQAPESEDTPKVESAEADSSDDKADEDAKKE